MSRNLKLHLGINGAFCARRWERPENWMQITRELGFTCHEFCADLIDPFFTGDREYQLELAREVREAAQRHGVSIPSVYSGLATHRFHGLSHSHPLPRQRMVEWIVGMMDIAREMGAQRIGGHFDTIPTEVLEAGEEAYAEAIKRQHEIFRDLAKIGRDKGLEALYQGQMYTPAEPPWTIKQAEEFLILVNRNSKGCPVYMVVDVGHMAGEHHGLQGRDLDYREWLRTLAPYCEVIHLQQTLPGASHHWPFTEEYNRKGHIDIDKMLEAIVQGHEHHEQNWIAEVLDPVEECWLILEVLPSSTKTQDRLIADLRESADYLKQWMADGELEMVV